PMAHLSGVAVAYKLIEALYERLPEVPSRPLSELVDLVAIGLIADLVELSGEGRYLAQIGIEQLQTHLRAEQPTRPGVKRLLQLCRRAGDRPTDIAFGIGPRINAVSRIYGDASFCVELLTSRDADRCRDLAEKAELANARRKALQNDVLQQVNRQLQTRDLSTAGVIVLCDPQWPVGVLGLVAGQIAQQYGKPTILLTIDSLEGQAIARGSARSVNQIDLYELVSSQAQLLTRFGGHPFAAGLSLPVDDLPMFTAAINQQYRQKCAQQAGLPTVQADLTVTVADLGKALFQQLKLLEPCGMGNPVPKLFIQNGWFKNVWHQKLKDRAGSKVGYMKASFQLCDESLEPGSQGFPGLWWGHYKEDLPPGRWDVIAELDYNSHPKSKRYEIRLIDIRPAAVMEPSVDDAIPMKRGDETASDWLLDRRASRAGDRTRISSDADRDDGRDAELVLNECPSQWKDLLLWRHQSDRRRQPLTLAYASPPESDPLDKWKTLLGLAKFIAAAQVAVTKERLAAVLGVGDRTLDLGLVALTNAGFAVNLSAIDVRLQYGPIENLADDPSRDQALSRFLAAVQEENFRRHYFYRAPISALQSVPRAEG
ncbi:MAG: DHHA1 domain-containing protein, partial [Phormidesmis sp.]